MKQLTLAIAIASLVVLTQGCSPLPYDDCGACSSPDTCFTSNATTTGGGTVSGRFCTRNCTNDGQCPTRFGRSGRCLGLFGDPNGTQVCFLQCVNDLDCPSGSACSPTTAGGAICLPGARPLNTYSACTTSANCTGAGDDCLLVQAPLTGGGVTQGRFCSRTCNTASDCPSRGGFAGLCGMVGSTAVNVCFQGCNTNNDCPGASKCTPSGIGNICIPGF